MLLLLLCLWREGSRAGRGRSGGAARKRGNERGGEQGREGARASAGSGARPFGTPPLLMPWIVYQSCGLILLLLLLLLLSLSFIIIITAGPLANRAACQRARRPRRIRCANPVFQIMKNKAPCATK